MASRRQLGTEVCTERFHQTIQPWQSTPYKLISWWDMEQFAATAFYQIGRFLEQIKTAHALASKPGDPMFSRSALDKKLDVKQRESLSLLVESVEERCATIKLRVSVECAKHIVEKAKADRLTNRKAATEIEKLDQIIRWEMKEKLFMFVPPDRAEFYDKQKLFGDEVNKKFPSLQYDIVEAGNCYALGRPTAAVFHLMRIAEAGVQEFGSALGVTLANEKNWQNILDEVNKQIKALPPKDPRTVQMSEVNAHLYSVKLAWRNQVMHPKGTYTAEEAEALIRNVRSFMVHLATVI